MTVRTMEGIPRGAERRRPIALLLVGLLVAGGLLVAAGVSFPGALPVGPLGAARGSDTVTVLTGPPSTLDPARQGDVSSAQISSQLFESLTAIDASLRVQPALASSWDILDGGRRVVFHLRPGLTFSDGTPLTATDVVASWMRVIDPRSPSPLSSLLIDVEGAEAHLQGGPGTVGITALGNDVVVRLRRPAADFPEIAANPTLAVVPAGIDANPALLAAGSFVGSGAYVVGAETSNGLTLEANGRYWAGRPPMATVQLVEDTGGRNPVQLFEDGSVDYTDIGSFDASWIAYDAKLGPSLRSVTSLSVDYYGFDTQKAPFDDPRVRRAFAQGVDWKKLVALSAGGASTPATGMVPPGVPGRGASDYTLPFDVAAARSELAAAGFPGGRGFPPVTLVTPGSIYDAGIVAQLRANLGVTVASETLDGDAYFNRLETDPPAFWSLSWVADYPGPNDFLGLLLGSGQAANYGRWSSPSFDQAITDAGSTTDASASAAAFDRAEAIVRQDVPVIPVSYSSGWALARDGLLGARENGLGFLRFAGLAWR